MMVTVISATVTLAAAASSSPSRRLCRLGEPETVTLAGSDSPVTQSRKAHRRGFPCSRAWPNATVTAEPEPELRKLLKLEDYDHDAREH
eukprot:136262-Rhodomonas_salina.2